MYDERGSIWRKWDLHVHTPASFHWEGGKRFREMDAEEENEALKKVVDEFENSEVAAFGIMDYWTFDGYKKVRDYLENEGRDIDTAIFPGIELRIEAAVNFRLNIHAILSDKLSNQQLLDFKQALKVKNIDRSLSDEALIQFARTLDESKAEKHGFDESYKTDDEVALRLGSQTAEITRKSFQEAFTVVPADSAFVIMPYDTSDGLMDLRWEEQPAEDNFYMQLADIFETRDKRNIKLFNGITTEENQEFIDNFQMTMGKMAKPAISGSDAHTVSDYGSYPSQKVTWVKADTEFKGLKQILIEPHFRTHVGATPPKKEVVKNNRTKFLSGLLIDKSTDAQESEIWFDNLDEVPLNHDLVAVIGNKGAGKSAFTDIAALVGKTKNFQNFSFLSPKKFRNPKRNKAKSFEATIRWKDGNIDGPLNLDADPEVYEKEMVKYLPQNFIEELCNPVTADERKQFETEIKDVIFSWVPESERYGKSSLDEIIDYRSDVVYRKVDELRSKINKTNRKIIELEDKLTEDYRKQVEENLREKKKELESHKENKPSKIEKPEELKEDEEFQTIHEELGACKQRIDELKNRKKEYQKLLKKLNNRIAAADRVINRIKMINQYADDIKLELSDELNLLDIDFDRIVEVGTNLKGLETSRSRYIRIKNRINEFIDGETEESINSKLANLKETREELENKLDEPDRLYQEYLSELEEWKKKKENIIGSESVVDSLEYLEKELEKIEDSYPGRLDMLKAERVGQVGEIHEQYQQLKMLYSNLYEPVSDFISDHKELLEDFNLSFDVSIESKEFKNIFLNKIHLGVIGSFYGESEANKYLSETHDSVDFNEADELISFLDTIYQDLHVHRETEEELEIEKQLKGDETKLSLYNFLFGLKYLEPTYQLKLDKKELYQLSPGERGTLLLIFYLLIDRDMRPLIIDQPEENLDNETVYKVLVRCIREAKKRRQVIIVTHNPNLAVVCDAEQIIVADIDKKNKNEVFYKTGSIENPKINERIINILEGTRPAFNNRDAKYLA